MQEEYGETALFGACAAGHVTVAALLIEKGAIVNHQNKVSPLWLSCSWVQYYLSTQRDRNL
jgi:ankyrin repeat protein